MDHGTEKDFKAAVVRRLTDNGMSEECATEVAAALAPWCRYQELGTVDRSRLPFEFRDALFMLPNRQRWAIQNEDLKLIPFLGTVVTTLAAAGFSLAATSATGMTVAAVTFTWSYVQHRVPLSPTQHAVLVALKTLGGVASAERLLEAVNVAVERDDGAAWSADDLHAELDALTRIRKRNGDVVALVKPDHANEWGLVDL